MNTDDTTTTLVINNKVFNIQESGTVYTSTYQKIVNMVKAITLESDGIINFTHSREDTQ
jgi:hypothetical protein